MFVPNVFSFATEGRLFRYGSIRMPVDMWGPWRDHENQQEGQLHHVKATVASMLQPEVVLDILQNFTLFATDKKHRRIKIICRYQQYFTTNQIVDRVVKGYPKKGLIWHFQGSGKSLLMVFAAQKLRMHPKLGNPTVIIVVDRIDLDTQITATFNATDVPNMVGVGTRQELQMLLGQDVRKVLITTIHKFGEAGGKLNERSNIIVMVDEAHRTQEGDLGRKMREALPNAFLFGLTGTPINRADRNTYWAFGADEDTKGYMSRYSFQDSIRDKATLPLHFEAPEVRLKIDKAAIDEALSCRHAAGTGRAVPFASGSSSFLLRQCPQESVLLSRVRPGWRSDPLCPTLPQPTVSPKCGASRTGTNAGPRFAVAGTDARLLSASTPSSFGSGPISGIPWIARSHHHRRPRDRVCARRKLAAPPRR